MRKYFAHSCFHWQATTLKKRKTVVSQYLQMGDKSFLSDQFAIVLLTVVFISMIAIGCYFRLLVVLGIFISIVNLYK